MKKTMVYTIAALLSVCALSGCGRMESKDYSKQPTELPEIVTSPGMYTPDPEDGYVRDEDGIITDNDTGRTTAAPAVSAAPMVTARPGASSAPAASASPGARSASPSPSADAKTNMQ